LSENRLQEYLSCLSLFAHTFLEEKHRATDYADEKTRGKHLHTPEHLRDSGGGSSAARSTRGKRASGCL